MKVEWNWPIIITATVAVYGAILSTINTVVNIKYRQARLSVTLKSGSIISNSPSDYYIAYGEASSNDMLFIEIANIGNKPATIKAIDINANKKFKPIFKIYNPINASLPYTLEEGKNCAAGANIRNLAKSLIKNGYSGKIKLLAYVTGGTGRIYKSKKARTIDLNQYAN